MKIKITNTDKLFFTSDPHFHHHNIIEFCNRPFRDSDHQNEMLIKNWNDKVPTDGTVVMAGDFALTGQIDKVLGIIQQLNGLIYWVLGNHCYQNRLDREVFKKAVYLQTDVLTIVTEDPDLPQKNIFVSHYPHLYWPRGSYHLHGHVHSGPATNSSEKVPYHPLRWDIGVDNNNFTPVSFNELKQMFLRNKRREDEKIQTN
jgi:calcineurin-like phosphoesterase family protein